MTTPPREGLLSPSDIAELAGVSRAAVSNWRKRTSDFPDPVSGTANKPLFATSDIQAWLRAHPEKTSAVNLRNRESKPWETALWGAANLLRGRVSVDAMSEIIVEAAVREVEGDALVQWPGVEPTAIAELRSAIAGIPRNDLAGAIDGVLERTSRAQGKSSGDLGFVGSRTSTMLASLAADLDGGTLYDPACGIGVALIQAVEFGARPDRLIGDELNETAARIAVGRGKLHAVNLEVNAADVLRLDVDPELRADVVIAEPPFGLRLEADVSMFDTRLRFGFPPRSSGDYFWLQHVVAHLAPAGVGYVVTSRSTLFRRGAEAEIRRNLLLSGRVHAVVALPGRMLPHTTAPLALWVLGSEGASSTADVLLIDASNIDEPENLVAGWLSDNGILSAVPHRHVSVAELAEGEADLSPPKWIDTQSLDPAGLRDEFQTARLTLVSAAQQLSKVENRLTAPQVFGKVQIVTVGDLVEIGAGEVLAARSAREADDPELLGRHVDASAVRRQTLPDVSSLSPAGSEKLLTKPGDVLITAMHEVRAVVDETGGHVPIGSVYRLRIRDRSNIDPHYLAEMMTGQWNLRFASGTTIPRIPVRSIEIPMLPIEDQRHVYDAVREARQAERLAQDANESAKQVADTLLSAVRYEIKLNPPQGSHK